jgi:anti-sigma factor RsiW
MMAQINHDEFDDELLSAYVDGELTAAERSQVEPRLRNDPAAASLVDELRTLSSTIKSLPRETLGRDLRAGVLAEVEQARADLDRHGPATLPMTPIDRRQGIRRGLVWSALAIAATVVVAVFQPADVEQEGRDLARAEKRKAEVEQLDRTERQLRAIGGEGGEGGRATADKFEDGTLAADAEALPLGLRASMSSGGVDGSAVAEGKEQAMAAVPASAPAPEAGAPLMGEAVPPEEPMLDAAPQDALAASALVEEAAETALAKDQAVDLQASNVGESLRDMPAKPPAAMQTPLAAALPQGEAEAGGEPLAMGGGGAFGPRGGAAFGIGGEAKSVEEAREGGQAAGAVGGAPTAKVTLKLASAEGALRFKQLLAESDIAPADDAAAKKEMVGRRADRFAESRAFSRSTIDAKQDAEVQDERSLYYYSFDSTTPSADAADGAKLGVELESVRGVKQPAANLVWVEATAAQIEALLEKCRDDKAAFAAVLADDMLALAKSADGAAAEMKLKRAARVEQAPSEPKSEIAASEKRERVLFVLEPATPALQPAAPATAPPATIEAK